MKRILCAVLMAVTLATPSFAAKLYLKDGGFIQARRVWQADGKVYVLATRDTLTSFERSEVNLKRTFPKHHRIAKKAAGSDHTMTTAAPIQAAVPQNPADKKKGASLPRLPEKSPETQAPTGGSPGAIRQHKKEMEERIKE